MNTSPNKHIKKVYALLLLTAVCVFVLIGVFSKAFASFDEMGAPVEQAEIFVGDKIGLVYYTNRPYSPTDPLQMHFTLNGRTTEVDAINNGGLAAFRYDDIYPHELGDDITASLYRL